MPFIFYIIVVLVSGILALKPNVLTVSKHQITEKIRLLKQNSQVEVKKIYDSKEKIVRRISLVVFFVSIGSAIYQTVVFVPKGKVGAIVKPSGEKTDRLLKSGVHFSSPFAQIDYQSAELEIKLLFGSALKTFCTKAADKFNQTRPHLEDGTSFFVSCDTMGSGDVVNTLLDHAQLYKNGHIKQDDSVFPTLLSVDGEIYQSQLIDTSEN